MAISRDVKCSHACDITYTCSEKEKRFFLHFSIFRSIRYSVGSVMLVICMAIFLMMHATSSTILVNCLMPFIYHIALIKMFLSGSLDKTIRLWDLRSSNCQVILIFLYDLIIRRSRSIISEVYADIALKKINNCKNSAIK